MPLTKAQCQNCGGALQVDSSQESAICPFCGTPYYLEKTVNNYVTNVTNNIQAGVVIVNGTHKPDYLINNDTLIKYQGRNKDVIIPGHIKKIDPSAFNGCDFIRSVQISDGITEIPDHLFDGCRSLVRISFPSDLIKIGSSAFFGCTDLSSVSIPDSVIDLGYNTFNGCTRLQSIKLPAEITEIGYKVFAGCIELKSVSIPSKVIKIGDSAFIGCSNLNEIRFPFGIIEIWNHAFEGCSNLTKISIPASVTRIGAFAFKDCTHLDSVEFASINTVDVYSGAFDGTQFKKQIKTKKSGGCYVATCVYGAYDCPQVWTLRRYRDESLGVTWYGRAIIYAYYEISPTIVRLFGNTAWFKKLGRSILDRMVKKLNSQGINNSPYRDKQW